MGRLQQIEDLVAGTLPVHNSLKLIVRGRPRYLDPQLDGGTVRFALKRGFQFTAILPDNQSVLSEDAFHDTYRVTLASRPSWIKIGSLIRIGQNQTIGELHIVRDLLDQFSLETSETLLNNYAGQSTTTEPVYVTLLGVPGLFFALSLQPRKVLLVETPYNAFPGDELLLSPTPDVLDSLVAYRLVRAKPIGTRPGDPAVGEPDIMYRYEVEVETPTGQIPFTPVLNQRLYLKAYPIYYRDGYGVGDIKIAADMGPFLLDVYGAPLLMDNPVTTRLGVQTFDSFGIQTNAAYTNDQPWQEVPANYIVLERPISCDQLLFWQRIRGEFQYKKNGIFQGVLDPEGQFVMSSDLLVPPWPVDRQRGWVIPLTSAAALRVAVWFDPQPAQYFDIPSNALTYIRPKILPGGAPIRRLVISMLGSPNSRVEIRNWQYDGSPVESLSYYMLGTDSAFGDSRWLAGGFCIKPLFFNLSVLKARYSDKVSRYNAGYVYV